MIENACITPRENIRQAASGVAIASGIKYSGNQEILQQIASPRRMLAKPLFASVKSRLVTGSPPLETLISASPYGGAQVDLALRTAAHSYIQMEVLQGDAMICENRLHLGFAAVRPLIYTHRLDLLPGSYRMIFHVDDVPFAYTLEIGPAPLMGEIRRVDMDGESAGGSTPFEFDGKQVSLNPGGGLALVSLDHPQRVDWKLRKGNETIWKAISAGGASATVEIPSRGIAPGVYRLEAATASEARSAEWVQCGTSSACPPQPQPAAIVSCNANLAPACRLAFIGHQWLVRGQLGTARRSLAASLSEGITDDARIEIARADALSGRLDQARDHARGVLSTLPENFDSLAVLAFVEARLQDYPAAAELYKQALSIHDSKEIRQALASLPASSLPASN